jgi:hypothetical protein
MKRIIKIISLCLFIANAAFAENKYDNKHFSINALVSNGSIANSQPLIMSLPASDGFAPNANVQVQQYPNSIKEYAELSIKQFKQLKFKVLQNKQTKTRLVLEYSGAMQGRNLHWYAIAYKKGNNVFLVTATSTETQWKTHSKALTACVKSFKLK